MTNLAAPVPAPRDKRSRGGVLLEKNMLTTDHCRTLRQAREAAGLSQADLGQRLGGVTRFRVSHLESGRVQPSYGMLSRWCAALGLSPELVIHPAATRRRKCRSHD